jgi:hypothetical protein
MREGTDFHFSFRFGSWKEFCLSLSAPSPMARAGSLSFFRQLTIFPMREAEIANFRTI